MISVLQTRRAMMQRTSLAGMAFVPAVAVSLTFALVPAFSRVAPFGWFIGCAMAAVIYYPLAKSRIRIREEVPAA